MASNKGLANADQATRHRVAKAGGEASGGQFKRGDARTKRAAKRGGESSR
jgi:general stress protein YciG